MLRAWFYNIIETSSFFEIPFSLKFYKYKIFINLIINEKSRLYSIIFEILKMRVLINDNNFYIYISIICLPKKCFCYTVPLKINKYIYWNIFLILRYISNLIKITHFLINDEVYIKKIASYNTRVIIKYIYN